MLTAALVLVGLALTNEAGETAATFDACAIQVARTWHDLDSLPSDASEIPALLHRWGGAIESGSIDVAFGVRISSPGEDLNTADDDLTMLAVFWDRPTLWNDIAAFDPIWTFKPAGFEASLWSFKAGRLNITHCNMTGALIALERRAASGKKRLGFASWNTLPAEEKIDGCDNALRFDPILFLHRPGIDMKSREIDSSSGEANWRAYYLPDERQEWSDDTVPKYLVGGPTCGLTVNLTTDASPGEAFMIAGESPTGNIDPRKVEFGEGRARLVLKGLSPGPLKLRVFRAKGIDGPVLTRYAIFGAGTDYSLNLPLYELRGKISRSDGEPCFVKIHLYDSDDRPMDCGFVQTPGRFSVWTGAGRVRLMVTDGKETAFEEKLVVRRDVELEIDIRLETGICGAEPGGPRTATLQRGFFLPKSTCRAEPGAPRTATLQRGFFLPKSICRAEPGAPRTATLQRGFFLPKSICRAEPGAPFFFLPLFSPSRASREASGESVREACAVRRARSRTELPARTPRRAQELRRRRQHPPSAHNAAWERPDGPAARTHGASAWPEREARAA